LQLFQTTNKPQHRWHLEQQPTLVIRDPSTSMLIMTIKPLQPSKRQLPSNQHKTISGIFQAGTRHNLTRLQPMQTRLQVQLPQQPTICWTFSPLMLQTKKQPTLTLLSMTSSPKALSLWPLKPTRFQQTTRWHSSTNSTRTHPPTKPPNLRTLNQRSKLSSPLQTIHSPT